MRQSNGIYREEALQSINKWSENPCPITMVDWNGWIFLVMITSLVIAIAVVLHYIFINEYIDLEGMFIDAATLVQSQGELKEYSDYCQQRVSTMQTLVNHKMQLYSIGYLTLIDLENAKDEYMKIRIECASVTKESGFAANILHLSKTNSPESVYVLAFADLSNSVKIHTNQEAYIHPAIYTKNEFSDMAGEVVNVGVRSVTRRELMAYFKNEDIVDRIYQAASPVMIIIKLTQHKNSQIVHGEERGSLSNFKINTSAAVKVLIKRHRLSEHLFRSL